MTITYVRDPQRVRIENAVKEAMEKAGKVIDDSTFKLVKKVIPFDERERAHKYDHVMLILNLIPGLKERLQKIKTSWLTLVDYPYLVLYDPIIEKGEKAMLTVRPTVEDASKILEVQLSCSDNNSRKRIERILKKKITSAGLAMEENDSSVNSLIDEFFDEDERTRSCSQNISLEVVHEGRIEEVNRLEKLGARKWRIRI